MGKTITKIDDDKYTQRKRVVMFSNGIQEFKSMKDASKQTGLDISTISKQIKLNRKCVTNGEGIKIRFMLKSDYDKLSEREINSILAELNNYKLVLLNTGQEFNTVKELSLYLNVSTGNVNKHLNGSLKTCGKLNDKKCVIRYKKDYDKLTREQIDELLAETNKNNYIILNTGQEFPSLSKLASYLNVTVDTINAHIQGYSKSCGIVNGKRCVIRHRKDYIKLTDKEINKLIHDGNIRFKDRGHGKVILYNTGKSYYRSQIYEEFNISKESLNQCLTGNSKSAGRLNGYPLVWIYEDKYSHLAETDKKQIDEFIKRNTTRYYFVNERKPFYSVKDFSEEYDIKNRGIHSCLNKKQKSTKWKKGENAVFIHLDEFNAMTKKQQNSYLAECTKIIKGEY